MSDPRRLSDDPSDPLARAVLRSMRDDVAPPELRRRTLAALGLAAGAVGVASAASSAKASLVAAAKATVVTTRLGIAAWVTAGALGGGLLVGAAARLDAVPGQPPSARASQSAHAPAQAPSLAVLAPPQSSALAPDSAAPPAAPAPDSVSPPTTPAPPPDAAPPPRVVEAPPSLPLSPARGARGEGPPPPKSVRGEAPAAPSTATPSTVAAPPIAPASATSAPAVSAPSSRALAAEIASLDDARRAFVAGDATGALRALATYEASFPAGNLRAEAKAMRVEALAASGDRAAAAAAGRSFLLSYPDSPLVERVRAAAGIREPKLARGAPAAPERLEP